MSKKTYKAGDKVYIKIEATVSVYDPSDPAMPYYFEVDRDNIGWLHKNNYTILDSDTPEPFAIPTPVASVIPDSPTVINLLTEIRDLLKAGKAAPEQIKMLTSTPLTTGVWENGYRIEQNPESTPLTTGVFLNLGAPSEEEQAAADAFVDKMKTDVGNPSVGIIPDDQPEEYKEMLIHSYIKKDSRRYDGVWDVARVGKLDGSSLPSAMLVPWDTEQSPKLVTLDYFRKYYKRHIED